MQQSLLDGRVRWQCPACGFVQYENPVPGAGILIEQDGGLVMVQRGHPPCEGGWALPSGFIEADESVEQAAVREAREETGLDVELLELYGVYSFPEGPLRSGLIIFYRARARDFGALRAGDDAREARLFKPDDIPPLCFRTHREVVARWRAAVGPVTGEETAAEGCRIRRARAADHARIVELMRLIPAQADMDDAQAGGMLEQLRVNANLEVWVAEASPAEMAGRSGTQPAVIAFFALSLSRTLTDTHAWLDALAVEPGHRRRGVGRAMFEVAVRRARERGASVLLLDAKRGSERAQEFYRACGFGGDDVRIIRMF
jgi:8-oxo-dGTP diphosphatase